jgi:O-antigen ligase
LEAGDMKAGCLLLFLLLLAGGGAAGAAFVLVFAIVGILVAIKVGIDPGYTE